MVLCLCGWLLQNSVHQPNWLVTNLVLTTQSIADNPLILRIFRPNPLGTNRNCLSTRMRDQEILDRKSLAKAVPCSDRTIPVTIVQYARELNPNAPATNDVIPLQL